MLCCLSLCLAALLTPREAQSDKELERRWERMSVEQRAEALEWFQFEVSELDTLQMRLIRGLVAGQSRDPADWPTATGLPHFDETEHAGKGKSKRKLLAETSSKVKSAIKKYAIESEQGERFPDGWDYDWVSGNVVVSGDPSAEDTLFRNALAGRPPGLDLARALCLRMLDRGDQRKVMQAFGHPYASRAGSVYVGLTLWEVWSSGKKFEVPDTDALGIVHEALGDWTRWKTPISSNEQRDLYGVIGELFQVARRYHDLRQSLADILLLGEARALPGYGELRIELHTLWVWSEGKPGDLARELPGPGQWMAFMEALPARAQADATAREEGRVRWGQLIADGARVRAILEQVLAGMGEE